MKIIGITEIGEGYHKREAYIAIVSRDELKAVADKARYTENDTFPKLKVGDEHDIAAGHNFRGEIVQAIKDMDTAYTKFAKVAPLAAQFLGIVREKEGGAA